MKSISLLTGLLLMTATPGFAQQATSAVTEANQQRTEFLGSPHERFRTSEMEAPRTVQTGAGPLYLVGLPPGLDDHRPSKAGSAGGEEGKSLSRADKVGAARRLIENRFPALKDNVQVNLSPSGIVVVRGEVPTLADNLAVGRTLLDLPGETAVLNGLTTRPPLRSDDAIRRDVERLLRADPELPNVKVQVSRQVVYFSEGAVPDMFITTAVQRVGRIRGVVDVLVGPLS